MYKKHQSRIRKFMANKSFIFFTSLLSLSVTDFAYGDIHTYVSVKNMIPSSQPHYSKKGYKIEPVGKGCCMFGVSPTSYTAIYGAPYGKIGVYPIHSLPPCLGLGSYQNFKIINNDTGKIVGRFKWHDSKEKIGYLQISTNLDNFIVNVTGLKTNVNNKLNLKLYRGNNVE